MFDRVAAGWSRLRSLRMPTVLLRPLRFAAAGFAVTATDFGIYFLTLPVIPFGTAKALSFTCAGVLGYLLNSLWIFARTRPSFAEVGRYTLINILALAINVATNAYVLRILHGGVYVAFLVAVSVTAVFSYLCFSLWVFRKI